MGLELATAGGVYWFGPASKNPGSFSRRSRPGRRRGGASKAAIKGFHRAAFKVKPAVRQAPSSARRQSTLQCEFADPTMSNRSLQRGFAVRVRSRSSFSLRSACRHGPSSSLCPAWRLCPTVSRRVSASPKRPGAVLTRTRNSKKGAGGESQLGARHTT